MFVPHLARLLCICIHREDKERKLSRETEGGNLKKHLKLCDKREEYVSRHLGERNGWINLTKNDGGESIIGSERQRGIFALYSAVPRIPALRRYDSETLHFEGL